MGNTYPWVLGPIIAFSTWSAYGLHENIDVIWLETKQLLHSVIAVVSDYGLCSFWAETNSLENLLALLSFNDLGGDCPNHCMVVWVLVWLQPILVAWAWGFWVGLLPLVWLAVLV